MAKKNIDKEYQKEIEKSIKLFDVAKPGSSRPATTARPVIVGHTAAIASDPMVKEDKPVKKKVVHTPKLKPKKVVVVEHIEETTPPVEEPVKEPVAPLPKKEKVIVPQEPAKEPVAEPQAESEKPSVEKEVEPEAVKADETTDTSIETEPATASEEPKQSGIVDALVDQVPDKKQENKDLADVAVEMEEIQRSIDSKEYYLPITTYEQKRNAQVVIICITLLIGGGAIAFILLGGDKINSLLNL